MIFFIFFDLDSYIIYLQLVATFSKFNIAIKIKTNITEVFKKTEVFALNGISYET